MMRRQSLHDYYNYRYGKRKEKETYIEGDDSFIINPKDLYGSVYSYFYEILPRITPENGKSIKTMRYLKEAKLYYSPLRRNLIDANRAKLGLPPLHYEDIPVEEEKIKTVKRFIRREPAINDEEKVRRYKAYLKRLEMLASKAAKDEKAHFKRLEMLARQATNQRTKYLKRLEMLARQATNQYLKRLARQAIKELK